MRQAVRLERPIKLHAPAQHRETAEKDESSMLKMSANSSTASCRFRISRLWCVGGGGG